MSQLPALASRQPAPNTLAGQQPSRAGNGATGLAGSALMQRTAQDVVALSKNVLDLSANGLSQRTYALGNATVDVAQLSIVQGSSSPATTARVGADITLEALERAHILAVMANAPTLETAATVLGIDASTLYRKRKQYGL